MFEGWSLSSLQTTYSNYCTRRDNAQNKIDYLEDLYDTLSEKKEYVSGYLFQLQEVAMTYQYFTNSIGTVVENIAGDCNPDGTDSTYSKLYDYYNALDNMMDTINDDLVDLRAEKRADILFLDDIADAIDAWWTSHENDSN